MKISIAVATILALLSLSSSGLAFQDLFRADRDSKVDSEWNDFNPDFLSGSGDDSLSNALMVAIPMVLAGGLVSYTYINAIGPFSVKRSVEIDNYDGHFIAKVEEKGLLRKTKQVVKDLGELDVPERISDLKEKIVNYGIERGLEEFLRELNNWEPSDYWKDDTDSGSLEESASNEDNVVTDGEDVVRYGTSVPNMPEVKYTKMYQDLNINNKGEVMDSDKNHSSTTDRNSIILDEPYELEAPVIRNLDDMWNMLFKSEDMTKYLYDEKDRHYGEKLVSKLSLKYLKTISGVSTTFYAILPRESLKNQNQTIRLRRFFADGKNRRNAIQHYFNLKNNPRFPVLTHVDQNVLKDVNKAYYDNSLYYRKIDPVVVEITGYVIDWSKKILKNLDWDNPVQDRLDQAFEFEEYFRNRLNKNNNLNEVIEIDKILGKNIGTIRDSAPIGFRTKGFANLKARFGYPGQTDLDFLNFITSSNRFFSFKIAEENDQ